jgi:protein SFI1
LSDSLKQAQTLQGQADQFYRIRLSEVCSAQLRKVNMKAFEVMQRLQSADAMRDRHWAKHRRNMLRHWAIGAREKSYQTLLEAPPESNEPELTDAGYGTASQSDVPGEFDRGHGRSGQPEEWSAFDVDLLENEDWLPSAEGQAQQAFTPIPTPGYLNTPSKRAARARALAKMSATPATPLVTPFSARLRAGMSYSPFAGTDIDTRRGIQERSDLGVKVVTAPKDSDGQHEDS